VRGNRADLIVDQGPETGFDPRLRVVPIVNSPEYGRNLRSAVAKLEAVCPGVGCVEVENGYLVTIPARMHQGHEARFSRVLDQFLGYVEAAKWPRQLGEELVAKYTLLAKAYDLSHH
jgi:hypothetical protein